MGAAERYYRTMWLGSTESWNLRDRHMFDTLQAVRPRRWREGGRLVRGDAAHHPAARPRGVPETYPFGV